MIYKFIFKNSDEIDIKRALYAMRCILIEFRTHRKDTMAKDAESIMGTGIYYPDDVVSILEFKCSGIYSSSNNPFKYPIANNLPIAA